MVHFAESPVESILLFWIAKVALAAQPTWAVSRWALDEGLPQSSVTAIARTNDGMLYIGTFGGIARFDGVRMAVLDGSSEPALPEPRVTALAADGDSLWVGDQYGGVARLDGRWVTRLPRPQEAESVVDQLWVVDGGILARVGGAAYRWNGLTWIRDAFPGPIEWVAPWKDGELAIEKEGGLVASGTPLPPALSTITNPTSPTPGPDGSLWVAAEDGVWRYRDGDLAHLDTEALLRVVPTADGDWAGAGGGAAYLAADGGHPPVPLDGSPSALYWDGAALWVGSERSGLTRYARIPAHLTPTGRSSWSLAEEPDGSLIVSGACTPAPLTRVHPDETVDLVRDPSGALTCAKALYRDTDGSLLAGTNVGIVRVVGDHVEPFLSLPGSSTPLAMLRATDGDLWVSTEEELLRLSPTGVRKALPTGLAASNRIHTMILDRDGRLWLGGRDIVARVDGAAVTRWDRRQGLPEGSVRSAWQAPDGTMWFGSYGAGIFGVSPSGATRLVTVADGLAENFVSAMVPDGDWVWLNGNRGVTRVAAADFVGAMAGTIDRVFARRITTGEGVGGTQPAGILRADGRVVVSTIDGPVTITPSAVTSRPPTPPQILSAMIDGRSLRLGETIALVPGPGELQIKFTAPTLEDADQLLFRYRLRELDLPWDYTHAREARWRTLKPGRYTLEIQATNPDGRWSAPVTAGFELPAPWYARTSSRIMFGVLVFGAGALLFGLRARVLERHNAQLRREIEQRRATEEALRESEAHYRGVFDGTTDALLVANEAGRIVDTNAVATALFGPDLRGRPWRDIVGAQADGSGSTTGPDGRPVEVAIAVHAFGRGTLITATDVSVLMRTQRERVELERRLGAASRTEALGRLAGTVAHDVNNVLTALVGATTVLRADRQAGTWSPDAEEVLSDIDLSIERGTHLTRQLLAFGKRKAAMPVVLDLPAVLVEVTPWLRRCAGAGTGFAVHVPRERIAIFADRPALELCLLNLVINAVEAQSGSPRVEVAAAVEVDPPEAPGVYAVLYVDDAGPGLSEEAQRRLCEPFFTTKPTGNGLGLASVQGFARAAGGFLAATRSPLGGARFRLALPRFDGADDGPSLSEG